MDKNKIMGLTQREIKERQAEGLVNDFTAHQPVPALGKSLNEMSLPFLTL